MDRQKYYSTVRLAGDAECGMKIKSFFILILVMTGPCFSALAGQESLARTDAMASIPQPLLVIDFKDLARKFDETVYDFNAKGKYWPLIWIDQRKNNFPQAVIGLYTAIGDIRQGPLNHQGTFHESLTVMGAVLGATLVGIDKSRQSFNYVGMLKNYFNRDTGWNIMQNNTNPEAGLAGGGYARDWWYDVYPNLLFYAIYDKYPLEPGFKEIARSIADQFERAGRVLKGNYNYSYFDYGKMLPEKNSICPQPDVAAGHAWVLYSAYKKFGDAKYLKGSRAAIRALEKNRLNPSYEVLMPFGAYMAARLNAEENGHFNVKKMLEWSLDETAQCRLGWGALVGQWNGFDISGIVGSSVDHGGYGFLMNTFDMAWPLVSMVRYDQSYAKIIGKWMLNAANAGKLFYPNYISREHQTLPDMTDLTKGVIAYEGLIRNSRDEKFRAGTLAPVAQGDGPKWIAGNPEASQFSVYGSAHVGIFGGLIQTTNSPGILQLDLLATDFYHATAYPTYLYLNPYKSSRIVEIHLDHLVDLYDTVSAQFVARNLSGLASLKLAGETAVVIVEVPIGATLVRRGHRLLANGVVIDYHSSKRSGAYQAHAKRADRLN
jgi:hypothetical protein